MARRATIRRAAARVGGSYPRRTVTSRAVLLALALLPAAAASAGREPPSGAKPLHDEEEGFLLGEGYRWARMNVVSRVLRDVVAIPANVGAWDGEDWAHLALWTGAVAVPWFAGDPSLDVRLDRWAAREVSSDGPTVWNDAMQPTLWASIAVGGFGAWAWASATGNDDVAQGMSLMGEALAVTQVYHLTLKLLVGRDGPRDGDHTGRVKGPANAIAVYPGGTPSGHAATLFSLTSAGFAYFRPPAWAQAIGYAGIGSLIAFHVLDNRHFLSEAIAGASLGWYVGRWVVRHRASWRYGERAREPRVAVVALPVAGGAVLAATGKF
jgi:membrane-associated phospholipid phosphatase